jgi:hypothetical protein
LPLDADYREYLIGERLLTGLVKDDAKAFRTFEVRLAKAV